MNGEFFSRITIDLFATVLGAARNFIMGVSQALLLFCFKAESTGSDCYDYLSW